jgi:hypothetical protein
MGAYINFTLFNLVKVCFVLEKLYIIKNFESSSIWFDFAQAGSCINYIDDEELQSDDDEGDNDDHGDYSNDDDDDNCSINDGDKDDVNDNGNDGNGDFADMCYPSFSSPITFPYENGKYIACFKHFTYISICRCTYSY